MIAQPTLGDLYKLHQKNHTASDLFAVVMLIVASFGAIVSLYAFLYVKKKLSIFKDPAVTGVLELKQTPPGYGTNPDPNFEVNVHYVCTNTANIDVALSNASYYSVDTYVSFYVPFLLCGQVNSAHRTVTVHLENSQTVVLGEITAHCLSLWTIWVTISGNFFVSGSWRSM